METFRKFSNIYTRYMSLIVIAVSAVALFFPPSFKWAAEEVTNLLGIAMLGMGMTLKAEDFKIVLQRPSDVLIGITAQFTIMPLLAYILAVLFRLPPELAVGVVLVGTCPGGTSSNIMTYLSKGDVALSVTMTACTTLLAPFVTPFLTLFFAKKWVTISLYAMFISITKVVLLPIVAGLLLRHFFEKFVNTITEFLPIVSVTAIILIVGGVVAISAEKILHTGFIMITVVVLHNLLGYALGYFVAAMLGMDISKKKTVSIEVGMQNAGLATSLAMKHFTPETAIAGAIFSICHNFSGSLLANWYSTKG